MCAAPTNVERFGFGAAPQLGRDSVFLSIPFVPFTSSAKQKREKKVKRDDRTSLTLLPSLLNELYGEMLFHGNMLFYNEGVTIIFLMNDAFHFFLQKSI